MKLWCATTNPGKLREFRLAGADVEVLPDMSRIAPYEEIGETFEEIAAQKALYYSQFADGPLFADDSGLEVRALGGQPGVRSARFAGEHATDAENNALLLSKIRGLSDRRARFVCVIALARQGQLCATFRGEVEGHILDEPRGDQGFGYDPLFFCDERGMGFAEIPAAEKFALSHRGKALRAMLDWIASARF